MKFNMDSFIFGWVLAFIIEGIILFGLQKHTIFYTHGYEDGIKHCADSLKVK